jgi:hypothetical protein
MVDGWLGLVLILILVLVLVTSKAQRSTLNALAGPEIVRGLRKRETRGPSRKSAKEILSRPFALLSVFRVSSPVLLRAEADL